MTKEKYSLTLIVVLSVLFFFYAFFPTNNSTMDAYSYAGYIAYNQNLFTPHHLLYNAFMYGLKSLFDLFGFYVDTLLFTKIINAFFAIANLLVFYKILSQLNLPKKEKLLYLLVLGFTFSLWRFGTENETYIVPIFFSLLGSLYFLKYIKLNLEASGLKYVFLSGLMGVIACLFHQIHFFWWLGLLIGFFIYKKRFKVLFLYAISAVLVPISYVLVLVFYEQKVLSFYNLTHYVFHDLYGDSVMTNFGWKGLFFQILNSFRTFFQLHPSMFIQIKENLIFIIPLLLGLFLLYRFIVTLVARKMFLKRAHNFSIFTKVHLVIFIANYLFAFYNYGNIEFMVMLPFLFILILVINYQINYRFLTTLAITMFIWNFSYGIFPNHFYNYYNDSRLVDFIIKNPTDIFVIKNATALNEYFYKTSIDNYSRIFLYYQIDEKSIDSLLRKGPIFTDIIDKPEILDKEKLTMNNSLKNAFEAYNKEKAFDYEGFFGTSSVYKITRH